MSLLRTGGERPYLAHAAKMRLMQIKVGQLTFYRFKSRILHRAANELDSHKLDNVHRELVDRV